MFKKFMQTGANQQNSGSGFGKQNIIASQGPLQLHLSQVLEKLKSIPDNPATLHYKKLMGELASGLKEPTLKNLLPLLKFLSWHGFIGETVEIAKLQPDAAPAIFDHLLYSAKNSIALCETKMTDDAFKILMGMRGGNVKAGSHVKEVVIQNFGGRGGRFYSCMVDGDRLARAKMFLGAAESLSGELSGADPLKRAKSLSELGIAYAFVGEGKKSAECLWGAKCDLTLVVSGETANILGEIKSAISAFGLQGEYAEVQKEGIRKMNEILSRAESKVPHDFNNRSDGAVSIDVPSNLNVAALLKEARTGGADGSGGDLVDSYLNDIENIAREDKIFSKAGSAISIGVPPDFEVADFLKNMGAGERGKPLSDGEIHIIAQKVAEENASARSGRRTLPPYNP